jgi:hypothetical protein
MLGEIEYVLSFIMTEWVKCNDGKEMPRLEYERVLFTDGKSIYSGVYWSPMDFRGRKYLFLCCCEGYSIPASHWMPLPKLPGENDGME